jgi:hypothetical protein
MGKPISHPNSNPIKMEGRKNTPIKHPKTIVTAPFPVYRTATIPANERADPIRIISKATLNFFFLPVKISVNHN